MLDNYVCGKCGKVAKTKQALERHAAYHEDDRPFSCEICLQRFKNSDDRGKHYRRLKRDGKYNIACQVCHKHFKTEDILNKHLEMLGCKFKNESKETPVSSEKDLLGVQAINDKTSEQEVTESVSEENIPGTDLNCSCKICEVQFHGTHLLKEHYKTVHNDNKKQVCIRCGQTLSSKDSLARHFSIFHQSTFPYSCDICNFKFKIKESLCKHLKFVHKDGGYPCTVCHRVFTQPVNLKKHLAVHSAQKNHICGVCGREFRWKQALQKHEALHAEKNERIGDLKACGILDEGRDPTEIDDCKMDLLDDEYEMKLENVSQREASEVVKEIEGLKDGIENSEGYGKPVEIVNDLKKRNERLKAGKGGNIGFNEDVSSGRGKKSENDNEFNDEFEFTEDFDEVDNHAGNVFDKRGKYDTSLTYRKRFSNEKDESVSNDKRMKMTFEEDKGPVGVRGFKGSHDDMSMKTMYERDDTEGTKSFNGPDKGPGVVDTLNNRRKDDDVVANDEDVFDENDDCFDDEDESNEGEGQYKGDSVNKTNGSAIENNESLQSDAQCEENVSREAEMNEEHDDLRNSPKKSCDVHYSALTSFSHSETDNVSAFVFKPSSIQNILSKPINGKKVANNEKVENVASVKQRKPVKISMKFPNRVSCIGQSLHNPFLIQDSRRPPTPVSAMRTNSPRNRSFSDDTVNNENESKSPTAIIPSGKFSMLKHMLSLQNEENFDKAVFENPLYNKPPELKDLKNLIERRKITEQIDSCLIEKYDLSAKQNIPFHWLGMSVQRKKNVTNDSVGNKKQNSESNEKASSSDKKSNSENSCKVVNASNGQENSSLNEENSSVSKQSDNSVNESHEKSQQNADERSSGNNDYQCNSVQSVGQLQENRIMGLTSHSEEFSGMRAENDDKHFSSTTKISDSSLIDPNISSPLSAWRNVLKTFDASTSVNNMKYDSLNDKQNSRGKCLNQERVENYYFPHTSMIPKPDYPIQSNIQSVLPMSSSMISLSSQGSTNTYNFTKSHCLSDVFSNHNSPSNNFAPFSRSLSYTSNNRTDSSFGGGYDVAPEMVHSKSDRALYHSTSVGEENGHGPYDDISCAGDSDKFRDVDKHFRINLAGNIDQGPGQGCSDRIQGHLDISRSVTKNNEIRSWSLPRPSPQGHSNHSNENINNSLAARNISHAHVTSSMAAQNLPYFPPYSSSEHRNQMCPSTQNKMASSVMDIFTAVDYSTKPLQIPAKHFQSNDVNNISEVMSFFNSTSNTGLSLDKNDLINKSKHSEPSQAIAPSIIDYSFHGGKNDKGNTMRFHMLGEEMDTKSDNSREKSDVSIFDLLKGQSEKPRQLENVDNLLDAYV